MGRYAQARRRSSVNTGGPGQWPAPGPDDWTAVATDSEIDFPWLTDAPDPPRNYIYKTRAPSGSGPWLIGSGMDAICDPESSLALDITSYPPENVDCAIAFCDVDGSNIGAWSSTATVAISPSGE